MTIGQKYKELKLNDFSGEVYGRHSILAACRNIHCRACVSLDRMSSVSKMGGDMPEEEMNRGKCPFPFGTIPTELLAYLCLSILQVQRTGHLLSRESRYLYVFVMRMDRAWAINRQA